MKQLRAPLIRVHASTCSSPNAVSCEICKRRRRRADTSAPVVDIMISQNSLTYSFLCDKQLGLHHIYMLSLPPKQMQQQVCWWSINIWPHCICYFNHFFLYWVSFFWCLCFEPVGMYNDYAAYFWGTSSKKKHAYIISHSLYVMPCQSSCIGDP